MTDKEIIKALESEIHLVEYADSSYADNVSLELLKNALDVINRQQAEIEMLESIINTDNQMIKSLNKCYEISKTEAIKEFADRLKEKFLTAFDSYAYVTYGDVVMAIENIVKEMVGAEE